MKLINRIAIASLPWQPQCEVINGVGDEAGYLKGKGGGGGLGTCSIIFVKF